MRKIPLLLISIMGLGLSVSAQAAEKRYVSDDLSTYVHSGPGTKYRIVGTLNAGEPVELISTDSQFAQVKDEKGRTVWLPVEQLSNVPSMKTRIPELEAENQKLRQQLDNIDNTWNTRTADMQQRVADNDSIVSQLKAENEKLKNELIKSGKKLDIAEVNLDDRRRELILQWFMYGGGVAGAGLIFGLILPHLIPRRKKRNDRWMN
ncbi:MULTISPECIES: TIGR04211 family SH3 domain-containing protein [Providencia]|uniref:Arylsulfatase n=1 Tax=Providencia heimbachae ATCC 35613 TaxID=1354272 RepID=A0A1B7JYB6_9GAMM|nr:TIGR04211 family SH3 domain-containing protein [Providencia heimbachae]MBP6122975.1 SH3 domain-containing protein [Providencia sp.]MDD9339142.1 TIGR04211 family SH3 domain-containing protein [Providencia heimbachae]NIH23780.1 SH3 domain-containing protein [Providencia heimbachae]OAT52882.1 arylsulfatase [Providencia heimbachae ATCC 35613]QCJ71227.1 SH3 domain-containing protein [Providencia heimbachae]